MNKKQIQKILKKKKLRATKTRLLLLDIFLKEKIPISVPQIQEMLKEMKVDLYPSTIYREVETLLKKKVITKTYLGDDKESYELSNRKHHHHLICNRCKKIVDVHMGEVHKMIERFQKRLERKTGASNIEHILEFNGNCAACNK